MRWAAGIIDGEGCLHIHHHQRDWFSLVLKVTMGHEETIRRLHDLFEIGSVQNQIPSRNQRQYNRAWSWICTTRQAEQVLHLVKPYLVTKAVEAAIALEYLALPVMPGPKRIPAGLAAERRRLALKLADAKPSARFRKVAAS